MSVLLISLLPTTGNLGIKYLHANLLKEGYQSSILFLPSHDPGIKGPLIDFINFLKPSFIGCGFMSYGSPFAAFLGKCIKEGFPEIPFLVGGIHPTINPEECLVYADGVCAGESEEAIVEIAKALQHNESLQNIQNLAFKIGKVIQKNPLRPLIEELDSLAFPEHFPTPSYVYYNGSITPMDMHLFRKFTRYDGKVYDVISSRGCPLSCSYCCNSFLSKLYGTKKIRKRSPHNVIEELRTEIEKFPDIIFINIHDDCFLAQSTEWHQEFARDYKKWIRRPFLIRSTPLHISEEKIWILRQAGLAWINMGLQSGSERINKEIFNRRVSNETFLHAASIAKRAGVSGYYDVILDNPFEQEEDIIQTLRVLENIPKPFQLELFTLTFYKGTDIYSMLKKESNREPDCEIKNYFNYSPAYLNKLVRISPVIFPRVVEFFIAHRKGKIAAQALNCLYGFVVIFIEPLSYFYLMIRGFKSLKLTLQVAWPTFKTKIKERLMKFNFSLS